MGEKRDVLRINAWFPVRLRSKLYAFRPGIFGSVACHTFRGSSAWVSMGTPGHASSSFVASVACHASAIWSSSAWTAIVGSSWAHWSLPWDQSGPRWFSLDALGHTLGSTWLHLDYV